MTALLPSYRVDFAGQKIKAQRGVVSCSSPHWTALRLTTLASLSCRAQEPSRPLCIGSLEHLWALPYILTAVVGSPLTHWCWSIRSNILPEPCKKRACFRNFGEFLSQLSDSVETCPHQSYRAQKPQFSKDQSTGMQNISWEKGPYIFPHSLALSAHETCATRRGSCVQLSSWKQLPYWTDATASPLLLKLLCLFSTSKKSSEFILSSFKLPPW